MPLGIRLWARLSVVLLCLLVAGALAVHADTPPSVSPELQSKLVELFSKQHCDQIVRMTNPDTVRLLRPNVMAIVAYCDPPWEDPEKIFALAERLSPTGDLILVLHAKYRTRKNYESAAPIWNKVMLSARNRAFREMAEEYFSGEKEEEGPINLSPTTLFGTVMVGAGQESNPRPQELSYVGTHGSGAIFTEGSFSWRRWYRWGSLATDYAVNYDDFFSESQFTLMNQELEIPVAIHLTSNKDIVFSPLAGSSMVGGSLFQAQYGLSVSGVVFKSIYKQSVEGAVFQDNYYVTELNALSAAHYRFQYRWEFFPSFTYLSGLLRLEHASAGNTSAFNGFSGYFPFSHTDVGVEFEAQRTFKGVLFSVAPSFAYRFDSEESTFPLNTTGQIVIKRRVDKIFGVEPSITIPLAPSLQLYAWYRYDRIWSNVGPHDYVNFNLENNTAGLALKASLSSY